MSNEIQFLLYNMPNADGKVQVVIKDDMVWAKRASNCFIIEKIPQKEWVSQILFVLLPCHSEFCLFLFYNTKISEISDMAKSWATFCCSGAYKKY